MFLKKIFLLLLALMSLQGAWAVDDNTGTFIFSGVPNARSNNARIDGFTTAYKRRHLGPLTIPSTVSYGRKTYKVTEIGNNAFKNNPNIVGQLTLPEGLTTIGEYAFDECTNITQFNLPSTLQVIKYSAFAYCYNVAQPLVFPASITRIEEFAFQNMPQVDYVDATRVPKTAFTVPLSRYTSAPFAGMPTSTMLYLSAGTSVRGGERNHVVGNVCDLFYVVDAQGFTSYDVRYNNREVEWNTFLKNRDYNIRYPFTARNARYYNRFADDFEQVKLTDREVYTHYLPYPTPIPAGAEAYQISQTQLSEKQIIFTSVTGTLKANTPYLIRLSAEATSATYPIVENVYVPQSVSSVFDRTDLVQPAEAQGWKFLGTSVAIPNATAAANRVYVMGAAKTWKPVRTTNAAGYVHAHRAFLQAPVGYSGAPIAFLLEDRLTAPTAIEQVKAVQEGLEAKQADIYDLSGRHRGRDWEQLPSGLYVVGGKKVYKF